MCWRIFLSPDFILSLGFAFFLVGVAYYFWLIFDLVKGSFLFYKEDLFSMRTYAKMRAEAGFVPSLSVDAADFHEGYNLSAMSDLAKDHHKFLLSAGYPFCHKSLYAGVARYLRDDISLLDFKFISEFDVFSQTPERYVQRDTELVVLEDVYSFLCFDGSFVSAAECGFGPRYVVRQKMLSCSVPIAEHSDSLVILLEGETVKHAFDFITYAGQRCVCGVLFEQRSDDRLLSAILYLSKYRNLISPYR